MAMSHSPREFLTGLDYGRMNLQLDGDENHPRSCWCMPALRQCAVDLAA